jgi:hypothetical protein
MSRSILLLMSTFESGTLLLASTGLKAHFQILYQLTVLIMLGLWLNNRKCGRPR